ncbi:MAG: zinc ribbon domain-containing protein [Phycisphaerae bacterium]|jgi:uncharacterized C2H2 Zn-finger protein
MSKKINHNSSINQDIKRRFVERDVLACFSYEMESVLRAGINYQDKEYPLPTAEDIQNAYEYKCPDCGEVFNPDDNCQEREKDGQSVFVCPACGKCYESQGDLENEPQEVFEWWIITEWLAKKLLAHNEPIIEWGNNWYWGRTCSGQAILLDSVISQICEEQEILEGQKYDWSKNK